MEHHTLLQTLDDNLFDAVNAALDLFVQAGPSADMTAEVRAHKIAAAQAASGKFMKYTMHMYTPADGTDIVIKFRCMIAPS